MLNYRGDETELQRRNQESRTLQSVTHQRSRLHPDYTHITKQSCATQKNQIH